MIAYHAQMQRLLIDLGLKLEAFDTTVRFLMRDLPSDHPRLKEIKSIRADVSSLQTVLVDCISQTDSRSM